MHVKLAGAAAVADLMCPKLVEVRGCVLFERSYSPEIFEDWWQAHPGNLRAIESVINHVHLWVFQPTDEDETNLEYKVIEQLAERMLICGRAAAAAQVPDRTFEIEWPEEYGPTISLVTTGRDQRTWQMRRMPGVAVRPEGRFEILRTRAPSQPFRSPSPRTTCFTPHVAGEPGLLPLLRATVTSGHRRGAR